MYGCVYACRVKLQKELGLRLLTAYKVFSERHVQHEHVDITGMPGSHQQTPKNNVRSSPEKR